MSTVKNATGTPEATPIEVLWDANGLTLTGLNALREPTPKDEVKQRPAGNTGIMLDYVDARFVMDRLDACAGPHNWTTHFEDVDGGGVRCRLGILVMGAWVVKTDVGDASSIEPIKGAHSDALKRAAVQWGIARDLYDVRAEASPARAFAPQAQPQQQHQPQAPRPQAQNLDPNAAPWACPIHRLVKVVPAGVSKSSGKPFSAFYACSYRDANGYCNEKGPQVQPMQQQQGLLPQQWAQPQPQQYVQQPMMGEQQDDNVPF